VVIILSLERVVVLNDVVMMLLSLFSTLLHGSSSESDDQCMHITPALISLHWLRVSERISFKLAVLTYRSIHSTSPSYIQSSFTRVADMTSRRRLRSSASHRLEVYTARSTLYSRQTDVPSCRRQHFERPSVAHHICTVTRGLQAASQDFPLFS